MLSSKRRLSNSLLIAFSVLCIGTAFARDKSANDNQDSNRNISRDGKTMLQGLAEGLPPDPVREPAPEKSIGPPALPRDYALLDEATKGAYQNALRAYYEYQRSGLDHRTKVFDWQLVSSKIIFFVVIGLVLAGVYFSGVQFHSSLLANRNQRRNKTVEGQTQNPDDGITTEGKLVHQAEGREDDGDKGDQQLVTHIEASFQGIRVSSPVLGVIILALSFLFFYLYLRYVYPITEIF